ncbi:MAG: thermonuclease family protein [Hyphomicrobiaceae bacterium]|nr:thermonuclease family protein [Hyphomicrobiaceae bacterium]
MWFWRKKSQGFDWHTYIPTMIIERREKRKAKLEQIKAGAVDGAVAVGKAAVAGAQAGARDVGRGVGEAVKVARKGGAKIADPVAKQIGNAGASVHGLLARPSFAMPFVLCGAIALASGIYRYVALPAERVMALVPMAVGLVLLVLAVPSVRGQLGFQGALVPARVRRIGERAVVPVLAALLVSGGYFWLVRGGMMGATQWFSSLGLSNVGLSSVTGGFSSAKAVEGKSAGVVAGDAIRLQGNVFRISGVESPDKQQLCGKVGESNKSGQSKRWKCGEAAVAALEKIIKGKAVRCVPYGAADMTGQIEARCEVEGQDVAVELVRQGHVFSSSLYFGGYAALESEARGQNRGIWGAEIERPADYRARIWEMAKLSAPDGCPIKGQVTSSGKTYVLPWSVDYSRTTIKSQRGERWFCSEDEAVAAGWKAAKRG